MGVIARQQKLNISAPILGPFTPNPLYEPSLSSQKSKKKRGCKPWAKSKSWRYWVFFTMIVVFFCLAIASVILVLSYLIWKHRSPPPHAAPSALSPDVAPPTLTSNGPPPALNSTNPAVPVSYIYGDHSYLIDVEGGEDENTRAAVGFLFRENELTLESGGYHPTFG